MPAPSAGSLVRMGALLSSLPYPADQPAQCPTNAVNAWISRSLPRPGSFYRRTTKAATQPAKTSHAATQY